MEITKKSTYTYSIEFKDTDEKNEILFKSLLDSKLLGAGTTITPCFKKIFFNATNVMTLQDLLEKYKREKSIEKLHYEETEKLLDSLSRQIYYLEKTNHTFSNFSLEDIIVITKNHNNVDNKKIFFILNKENLLKIKNKLIKIITPFDLRDKFLDPEIAKIYYLPSKVHYKCIYYSLSSLALYCIFQDFETNIIEEKERKLEQIKFTKLYWKIIRYMDENYEKRLYL
jgi:hypothetical protein